MTPKGRFPRFGRIGPLALLCFFLPFLSFGAPTNSSTFSAQEVLRSLPPLKIHKSGVTSNESFEARAGHYRQMLQEKIAGKWFAAFLEPEPSGGILRRFEHWQDFSEFLLTHDALIEVWAYTEQGHAPRRIPATELAQLKKQTPEPPTFITATFREDESRPPNTYRVEFGFGAATEMLAAARGYEHQRQLQAVIQKILGARDGRGRLSAQAQWEALTNAVASGQLQLQFWPSSPGRSNDLLVAAEYTVDAFGNISKAVVLYRASEIQKRIARDREGSTSQILSLKPAGQFEPREALGFQALGTTGQLVPAPSPVLGQDIIELRVRNLAEPDPRRWNVLEFGEPEVLKASALAHFSLINAHLERQRKAAAVKKTKLDLIAEPIIVGLNIGGGIAGLGLPAGEVARLAYNLITPQFIPEVPSVKELRELFVLLAAKQKNPELKTKPARFLSREDIRALEAQAARLAPEEIQEFLNSISDDDLRAMLDLARMREIDAQVTNFLNLLTSVGKVSGVSEAGVLREIFNSPYFGLNGEINLSTSIAVLAGERGITPLSGVSLEQLSQGHGPAKAWLQFLGASFDVRALINSLARIPRKTWAEKELYKPFPYVGNLTDVASYEIRLFGFPLFIFYKAGLIKKDFQAYQEDYAYGVEGPVIVEHFKTKEDLEREIRAGRMAPIGYVKVPNGTRGWKDSNLAVFAHRRRAGKKEKMALVIYGLKAYQEHAAFMDRELKRMRQVEQALDEGGVIEKLVEAEDADKLAGSEFEPRLHAGPIAVGEVYGKVLGNLQELRRCWRRNNWGLPVETNLAPAILQELAAGGIEVAPGDPLAGVDPWNSTFQYRRLVGGKRRLIQLTLIPSRADATRALAKAEEAERIAQLRRQSVSSGGEGVVLLNRAEAINGRYEAGPLLQDANGQVIGFGLRAGQEAVEEFLTALNHLPVTERARLGLNHFSSTVLDLDLNQTGRPEKVFVTVEFPEEMVRSWTNSVTDEQERLTYQAGHLRRLVTPRRIVELDYDASGHELSSRTWANLGTLVEPQPGVLLEQTQTLEVWDRDLPQPNIDPYQPAISKLKVQHVLGRITCETYGLLPSPVSVVDDQFITEDQFNANGILIGAKVLDNQSNKILDPIRGRERFLLSSISNAAPLATFLQKDLGKGLEKTIVLDNRNWGRKTAESWTDSFGGQEFTLTSTHEYREDFHFGLVPVKVAVSDARTGKLLSSTETQHYEPVSRRLTGMEVDYTGKSILKVWDYPWENPVEIQTSLRKTTIEYNREETSVAGHTISKANGELLESFAGEFHPASGSWEFSRTNWFRPSVAQRIQTETRSGFGKLMSLRAGEVFETHVVYQSNGIEEARKTSCRNPLSGQFDLLAHVEDHYRWREGARTARVQTYVDGLAYDSFEVATDSEGRLTVDGLRRFPGVEAKTLLTYDGASDRVLKAETFQNDQLRLAAYPQAVPEQSAAGWLLPVKLVPAWGLTATQAFLLGDAWARPTKTIYENGDSVRYKEFFDGTALARTSELLDARGRVKERFVKQVNYGTHEGIPYDLICRYKIGFWGTPGLAEEQAMARGTDILLFTEAADERILCDLTKVFNAPLVSIDPRGEQGMTVRLNDRKGSPLRKLERAAIPQAHVYSISRAQILTATNLAAAAAETNEASLVIETVDLRGLFYHKVTRQKFDEAGHVLEETVGRLPHLGEGKYSEEQIFQVFAEAKPTKKFYYHYEPGWLIEQAGLPIRARSVTFSSQLPQAGPAALEVNLRRREFLTQIDGLQTASEEPLDSSEVKTYVFRRIHSPRFLEANPHMPGRPEPWSAWTTTEFGTDGEKLLDSEAIYDAQGRACVVKTSKRSSSGQAAIKRAYFLPAPGPEVLKECEFSQKTGQSGDKLSPIPLETGGNQDLSSCDFLYLFGVDLRSAQLLLTDGAGRKVRVGPSGTASCQVAPWPISSANARWLPDRSDPEYGLVLNAPDYLLKEGHLMAISIHDLDGAGLDIHRVQLVQLLLPADGGARAPTKISPLYRLVRGSPYIADANYQAAIYEYHEHATKLTGLASAPRGGALGAGPKFNSVATLNGLPVLLTRARAAGLEYPHLNVVDYSDADSPRPLYALSTEAGHFLEHYKLAKGAEARVYTIVRGFAMPRLELFRGQDIADEIAPGAIAYGPDYAVALRYTRHSGRLGGAWARLNDRIAANIFNFGAEQWLGRGKDCGPLGTTGRLSFAVLHDAKNQSETIAQLPMLAEAVLPRQEAPWKDAPAFTKAEVGELTNDLRAVGFELVRSHLLKQLPGKPYSLAPTASQTAAERFVDTAAEADLIVLAIRLRELDLARDLLDFYWEKSQGGTRPLHASYDLESGTALTRDARYKRPVHAPRTARTQLAMAEAALAMGMETGEGGWVGFSWHLTKLTLSQFRGAEKSAGPRGVTEFEFLPTRREFGVTLWPEEELYSLGSNARAYLLLAQMRKLSEDKLIDEALGEQEAWLRKHILPFVQKHGVVPAGLFQIQNIQQNASSLGVEHWTSAEDWLLFLEAGQRMGLPAEDLRRWLEHLARLHGVRVQGTWGLDWSLALLRPDAISSEMTARFWRAAKMLEDGPAEAWARQGLGQLRTEKGFPVVRTTASSAQPLQSGQGFTVFPETNQQGWPVSLAIYRHLTAGLDGLGVDERENPKRRGASLPAALQSAGVWKQPQTDLTVFILITAGFYLSILAGAVIWWRYRALRRKEHSRAFPDPLVSERVLGLAEERWAKRVLGMVTPAEADQTRYANGPVEQNFLMQLRAIYKLIAEWRRQENGWSEEDRRLVEDEKDAWLNGLDEFACLMGLYMRWVIKAGAKDGATQKEVLEENEDSNYIWSRLVMYLSEYYWGLFGLMRTYNTLVLESDKQGVASQLARLLNTVGIRQRPEVFDARQLFNFPTDAAAMDLLCIQKPGMSLDKLCVEISRKLKIPYLHILRVIEGYKEFKRREQPNPIHPYWLEAAKLLPHFLLMALGALVWYNQSLGDSPIFEYLFKEVGKGLAESWSSLLWALPLLGGLGLSLAAYFVKIYRFDAPMLPREKTEFFLDATLTSLFVKRHSPMPRAKTGRYWRPALYEWTGWTLRAIGFFFLGLALWQVDTPSFATFLVVKGVLAMLAFLEVAAVVLPLGGTAWSAFLQDWVGRHPDTGQFIRFLNRLNIAATQPASPLWLSLKYHLQPSVPTGNTWSLTQAVIFYFVQAAVFLAAGVYLCRQIFSLWIMDAYLNAADGKLIFGGLIFWNTMYLLRYGLFFLFTGAASFVATWPAQSVLALLALAQMVLAVYGEKVGLGSSLWCFLPLLLGMGWLVFGKAARARWQKFRGGRGHPHPVQAGCRLAVGDTAGWQPALPNATLGIVFMSGDDLCALKLTPELLLERWQLLRDKFDSASLPLVRELAEVPDDAVLLGWFQKLSELEQKYGVTLWHPRQLCLAGEPPAFRPELGLNLVAQDAVEGRQILAAWHVRRWLVCMMSTAGHSQDTAINLADIGARLAEEGLAANTAFYLIQNKYDGRDDNRPCQCDYAQGELGQRNKLARLLCELAPGARAYNLQNWTPFGFKAGGLTATDMVHEEALNLTSMLLLDRNATVHDLDALMEDVRRALSDPDVVIIVPGRSTTNTLTAVGQGSQVVEEGHRAFLKGLMTFLGGQASEGVGTGWGNLMGVFYGRVQKAMLDAHSLQRPLTSRMQRGSSFQVRTEGLIGFAPHAVGISEDLWAVSQATHNAIALGHRVKFLLSRALWHKMRETWSHSEWLSSFPRWSGGYLQMLQDPLMQQINDLGPQSVFAKELRANSGRYFLTAPFALLNILLMPLAIMLDVTPFVQILIVLWNFGLLMNQIMTVQGLNLYLECSGFYRLPALAGAAGAGLLALAVPKLQPLAPGLLTLGFLLGGFMVGLGRWGYTRVRDILLFGPQLVLHGLGQVMRQSLEFIVSGASPSDAKGINMAFRAWAGPREDRPLDGYAHLINLKTVVWGAGLGSLILNLFALSHLDMLNVLLLLPSLLFSVSALIGPFILQPRAGRSIGAWALAPKVLAWPAALFFYTLVSWCIAAGGWHRWAGFALLALVFGLLLKRALKYAPYQGKVRRAAKKIAQHLSAVGVDRAASPNLARRLLQQSLGEPAKMEAELGRLEVPVGCYPAIIQLCKQRLRPLLLAPRKDLQLRPWTQNRFLSDLGRSLVLALLVLIWFFVVPVPGLFVFRAGEYRLAVSLAGILNSVGCIIGVIVVSAWLGECIQWLDWTGGGRGGLKGRFREAWGRFHELAEAPGRLSPAETATLYALFTQAQTYLDQRSYAYVRQTLDVIREKLEEASIIKLAVHGQKSELSWGTRAKVS